MTVDLCWCLMCFKFLKKIDVATETMLLKMSVLQMKKSKIFDFPVLSNFLSTNCIIDL